MHCEKKDRAFLRFVQLIINSGNLMVVYGVYEFLGVPSVAWYDVVTTHKQVASARVPHSKGPFRNASLLLKLLHDNLNWGYNAL